MNANGPSPETDRSPSPSLRPGLAANYASFFLVALAGLTLNFVVLGVSDARVLGVFSQTYVVFVIAAQAATCGMHIAVLQRVARVDRSEAPAILRLAVVTTIPISILVALLTAVLAAPIGTLVDSSEVSSAIRIAAIGLPFHALNKVLIGYVNALNHMHHFAAYQALRGVGLTLAVTVLAVMAERPSMLAAAFAISEVIVTVTAALTLPRLSGPRQGGPSQRELLRFGIRASAGGLVQEVNARVDVVVLAVFVTDERVGVFAIASTVIEGLYQLLVVIRNNLNPLLASALERREVNRVNRIARDLRRRVAPAALLVVVIVVVATQPALRLAGYDIELDGVYAPLVIMVVALGLVAPLIPFDQALVIGGFPGAHSMLMLASLLVNVCGGLVLVPTLGLSGAAISTAMSLGCIGIGTAILGRRMLGVKLV